MVRVGQKLYEERIKRGLTLEDVAKATKIKTAFLSAIEKGEYQKLPSSAYVHGFVRNYAEFLDLSKREVLAMFRRDFDEESFKVLPDGLVAKEDFPIKRIRLQQTVIVIILTFIILLSYILFQYRYAFINPPLEVDSPQEKAVLSTQSVAVSGITDPNATVFVNNISVSLDQNGAFKKTIDLFIGKTIIKIKAVNRFGKQTEIERHVEVKTGS